MDDEPSRYAYLTFNSPLADARADALVAALVPRDPRTVLDLGCGWGELLLRLLAAAPSATGTGVDSDESLIARARTNAEVRGLSERATFVRADASEPRDRADVTICIGADHVFGTQEDALRALRHSGRIVLFGGGYWQQVPSEAQAAALGATPDELRDLAGLVDLAVTAGWRPLDIQTANEDEWNAFESGYLADREEWLHRNPSHPEADAVRAQADQHRAEWLGGYRDVLGFAYLVLV